MIVARWAGLGLRFGRELTPSAAMSEGDEEWRGGSAG